MNLLRASSSGKVDHVLPSKWHEKHPSMARDGGADLSTARSTQIHCVIRVLQDSVDCVKSALLLPKLLRKPSSVAKVLHGTEYQPAIRLVEDYIRRRDIIVKEQRHPLMDHGMIKLIDYFQCHPDICTLFPDYHMTPEDRRLLIAFEQLFGISKHHLQRSAKKEISNEHALHKIYQENEHIKDTIKHLKAYFESQKLKLRWKMAAKGAYLQKCELKLEERKMKNVLRMQNESEACQRQIHENQKNSLEKQKLLEIELEKLRVEYENQTKSNMLVEKSARAERNKLQIQLEAAIKKYDRVIGEKMIEHLDLENELVEKKKLLDAFILTYKEEEKVYNNIVIKREQEDERKRQQAIMLYRMNRAARKIQNYWRAWRKSMLKRRRYQSARYT
ncbi:dynein regulatory complex protein 9 isoform X2 [Drosophila virilis]|uniref:Dynein regulatory complex protein 10 n=1 Tax=Drosophila virilis TaxID=7244 RepID=A0A0Q9W1S4_DROVI|nr:dynein regulatory complex protein 9 isoform X2 [Drosophila virilis]KRF79082.1 uncharacterized protein Dvir_GJ10080, isoform B [Drosophila virilis]